MRPTDQQIVELLGRLSLGEFDEIADWSMCFKLVRDVIRHRKLPACDYAPTSRYGGVEWTNEDVIEICGEWIVLIRGDRARGLLGQDQTPEHIANTARLSVFHLLLGQKRPSASQDLWAALKEAWQDFKFLATGCPLDIPKTPSTPFPWHHKDVRSTRRRSITVPEVRDALAIIKEQNPSGWSVRAIFNYLRAWSGLARGGDQSLDAHDCCELMADESKVGQVDSESIGRDAAAALLRNLDDKECTILRDYIIPNGLGSIGLEEAATALGLSKSTLDDRAKRLKKKLASTEFGEVVTMDSAAKSAFLAKILDRTSGKMSGDHRNP